MKILRALIVIGVLLGGSIWLWRGQHRAAPPEGSPAAVSLPQAGPEPAASQAREAADARSETASALGRPVAATVQALSPAPILSAEEIKAMDPALVALSPEEAGWLYEHG